MDWSEIKEYGKSWTIECGGQIEGDLSAFDELFKLVEPKHMINICGEVGINYHKLKQLGAKFYTKKIKGKQYARPFYLNMYSMEREVEIFYTKQSETDEGYSFEVTFQGCGWPESET